MSSRKWPGAVILVTAFAAAVVAITAWQAAIDRLPVQPAASGGGAPILRTLEADATGLALPKKLGSLRFAVMGDVGRGDAAQYDTANELARWHERFEFSFVLMLGDNNYGAGTPEEYALRFERPYKVLLDRGVTFHAALGNHDPPGQTLYAPYNMGGHRYYTFSKDAGPPLPVVNRQVDFIALDTVRLDAAQLAWLRRTLAASRADWKIAFYHHPLYTSGRYRFAASQLKRLLEPPFVQFGLDVGFNGHEHLYERIVPQRGVQYFTSGGGGALRIDDLNRTSLTAAGFDDDTHFMLVEIAGDELSFQVITRTGATIDQGRFERVEHAKPLPLMSGP